MLRLLVVSVSGVPISSLLPMPAPNWFTCVIFRARSQMKQSKSSFVVMASSIRWILRPTLIFPMFSKVVVWPRTCRLQSASPVMMFVFGIKANLKSSPCAAPLVIAFKTVLSVVSDVVAVSLGIWLASVPPFNRLLLPLLLIPFLLFLHATDSVFVSGADPSMSADEEENRIFFYLSAYESGSCSGDNECSVLFPLLSWFPVPGSVLLRLHLLRLLVWLSSLLLSPPSISRTKSLSCRVNLILLLPRVPAAATSDFASAKSSVTKSVVSCFLQVCSCFWKARFCYCKVFRLPVYELGVSRRSGSGYVVFDCPDSQVFWDFGSLSRSIEEVDLISFEYTIVSWNMLVVRFRGRKHLLCGVSFLFLKMLLTPCLLVGLLSSLDRNLFPSSIDPLLMYWTSLWCVNVFVASYFV